MFEAICAELGTEVVLRKWGISTTLIIVTVMIVLGFGFFSFLVFVAAGSIERSSGTPITESSTLSMVDTVMNYIRSNHTDAAALVRDGMSWTKKSTDMKAGYTANAYLSGDWQMTIGHAIVPGPVTYEVIVENKNNGIMWLGTVCNGSITEISYTHVK